MRLAADRGRPGRRIGFGRSAEGIRTAVAGLALQVAKGKPERAPRLRPQRSTGPERGARLRPASRPGGDRLAASAAPRSERNRPGFGPGRYRESGRRFGAAPDPHPGNEPARAGSRTTRPAGRRAGRRAMELGQWGLVATPAPITHWARSDTSNRVAGAELPVIPAKAEIPLLLPPFRDRERRRAGGTSATRFHGGDEPPPLRNAADHAMSIPRAAPVSSARLKRPRNVP